MQPQTRDENEGRILAPYPEFGHEAVTQRNAVVQLICDFIVSECNTVFGGRIIALILTGSAARGEATIVNSGDHWRVLGDVEFLAVLSTESKTREPASAETVKLESSQKLRSQGIEVAIDLGLVDVSYLKKLPPHIFSYELRACGRVISGDASVLQLIPLFSANDISREDAWRMLCNRMIEHLGFVGKLDASTSELGPELHYATVKLFLDMATSYLVFSGRYAPSYRERAQNLSALVEKSSVEPPFPLKEFSARVAECTSWKISGEDAEWNSRVDLWREAVGYLRRLWHWEAMQLVNATGDLSDAELWRLLARQLSARQKLRGWASLTKRGGWLKSWRNWPRWLKLGVRATPRYWIYRAGMEIAFNLPDLIAARADGPRPAIDCPRIATTLPAGKADIKMDEEAWRPLAGEIVASYWKYLAGTRA